ncbi:cell migration-inducing and hyaluronan-binding protein-like [Mercenaria mercenaria]|uniref:cell migration-inducing and hyaluronan-binding protein-like n=1 Tax=Mercenaria mercenaria TaxID=6596 RepID=UPI00234F004D|nr:cell migration-inducing and hyaluronan-binding protein-like [Mercenaria mercenaria]
MYSVHVFLYVACMLICVYADCPHERTGLKRRSVPSTWSSGTPSEGDSIEIIENILMDISPPALKDIKLLNGGSLTFLPDVKLTLKAANIYISQDGTLEIGSEDCPYMGKLTITLTGNRELHQGEKHPKAILVEAGGTLEIHGEPRLPWTKITKTLSPPDGYDSGNYFYNHEFEENQNTNEFWSGVVAYTFMFDNNGEPTVKEFDVYLLQWHNDKLAGHINRVKDGEVLMMASQIQIESGTSTAAYDAFERLLYGEVTGSSIFRSVKQDGSTWAFVYQKGNPDSYSEETNPFGTTSRATFCTLAGVCFMAEARKGDPAWGIWDQQDNFIVGNIDAIYPLAETTDEVTTWREGDRVIFASTDYDWNQAEERKVVSCEDCESNQFRIDGPAKYVHYGKVLHGALDMRAEVLLLNRDVVIQGEMDETCPAFNGNCEDETVRGLDTFGAHVKVLKDYANVHIENAEFYNVGQQTDLGRYPIHFHMTLDKVPDATVSYIRGNSIHNSFARCITIHGSHGIEVIDNTCYNHMGHGYFLEDGGEENNLLDGNLAMTTRKGTGTLEPVDKTRPAGFWLTNPNNRFRNNVAAGGEGTGVWVLYPDEPLPPSRSHHIMEKFEAKRTMIQQFENHVAHSNLLFGIMIGDRETEERDVHCCNEWQPRADPKDENSTPLDIILFKMTGYKNRFTNIWIEGGLLNVSHISVADSLNGIFVTNEGQQDIFAGRLSHAVIIGESENKGVPTEGFTRSLPFPWTEEWRIHPQSALTMWKGPTQYSDIWFDGFTTNSVYDIAAIAKKRESPYPFSVTTPFRNALFAFDDEEGGGRIAMSGVRGVDAGWDFKEDGELVSGFTYYVETPEGEDKFYFVKPDHLSAAAADCAVRPSWRLALYTTKYGNLRVLGGFEALSTRGIFVRDDLPSAQFEFELKKDTGPQVVLDGSRTYTFHSLGQMPDWIRFSADGIETGDSLRIGICTPLGAAFELQTFYPNFFWTVSQFTRVNSLAELDKPDPILDGKKFYLDETTGMLYYKFVGATTRDPKEAATCGGGKCPELILKVQGSGQNADCRERLYGTKMNMEKPALQTYTDVIPATGGPTPPTGYGAGPTKPFLNRGPVVGTNLEKVDGGYGQWSGWSKCSVTCGAIDGGFTDWTKWSSCKVFNKAFCSGFSKRTRKCSNPKPTYGGKSCTGATQEIEPCDVC